MKRAVVCLAVMLCALTPVSARAAANTGWTVTLGPGLQWAPPYEGAKHYTVMPFPWIVIGSAGSPARFIAPDESPGIGLFAGRVRVGLIGGVRGARNAEGSRTGLRAISWALEPGLSGDIWLSEGLRFRAEIRKGVHGHAGWLADLSADALRNAGPWTFSIGPRVGLGDSPYMNRYFGVSAAEALANPAIDTTFRPGAGFRFVGVHASASYRHGPWQEVVGVGYKRLFGDAAASPIVTALGTADQFAIIVAVLYRFGAAD